MIYDVLVVLEIIVAEFISIWTLSQRKHGIAKCIGLYVLITAVIIAYMYLVAVHQVGYGSGNGRNMIIGVLYLVPALVNFGGSIKSRLIVGIYTFAYGIAVFAISVKLAYVIAPDLLNVVTLICQTILFAVTLPLFLKYSEKNTIAVMRRCTSKQRTMILWHNTAGFFLIIALHNTTTGMSSAIISLIVYLLFIYFLCMAYRLEASLANEKQTSSELEKEAKTDKLTGLGNRKALYDFAQSKIEEKQEFCLYFIDLDNFKQINDQFGHNEGDDYLYRFGHMLQRVFREYHTVYRISGDEFICIAENDAYYDQLLKLGVADKAMDKKDIKFLGASVGMARYPRDGTTLTEVISVADRNMYTSKKLKDDARLKKMM